MMLHCALYASAAEVYVFALQGPEHMLAWLVGLYQVQMCYAHCHE